jgi:hypothetical protein
MCAKVLRTMESSLSAPNKPNLSDDETFMSLYCACLTKVSSQLEQTVSNDGLPARDIYSESLKRREQCAVSRAFRMACLAKDEFNKNVK